MIIRTEEITRGQTKTNINNLGSIGIYDGRLYRKFFEHCDHQNELVDAAYNYCRYFLGPICLVDTDVKVEEDGNGFNRGFEIWIDYDHLEDFIVVMKVKGYYTCRS